MPPLPVRQTKATRGPQLNAQLVSLAAFRDDMSADEAATWLSAQLNRPPEPFDLYYTGKLLYQAGRYRGAATVLQQYVSGQGAEPPGFHLLAHAYWLTGRSARALPLLKHCVSRGFDADWQLLVQIQLEQNAERADRRRARARALYTPDGVELTCSDDNDDGDDDPDGDNDALSKESDEPAEPAFVLPESNPVALSFYHHLAPDEDDAGAKSARNSVGGPGSAFNAGATATAANAGTFSGARGSVAALVLSPEVGDALAADLAEAASSAVTAAAAARADPSARSLYHSSAMLPAHANANANTTQQQQQQQQQLQYHQQQQGSPQRYGNTSGGGSSRSHSRNSGGVSGGSGTLRGAGASSLLVPLRAQGELSEPTSPPPSHRGYDGQQQGQGQPVPRQGPPASLSASNSAASLGGSGSQHGSRQHLGQGQ